ncbi:Hypersensitivity response secretion protein HrcV [Paraburkholderia sabiae]|uniref:type III secretion system export apparatus subunit SctV n=1 Tax=Paraburkholderia sabiae TaxID=273251 RepID=UPI001CB2A690|nr:type III secretion system export apparatus subunit SctV [Paraburkholderia sabiae]CAG9233695.1 Hypersensitivity response secretion protein HrcV [Paraburkholderia sabiae]
MLKTLKLPPGGEIGILVMIIAIVSLMILPLPFFMIDILVGLNIATAVTLLMITLYVPSVVSLSAFPSILLFTTLYRLSLSIASTKSILLHAEAGDIIDSFGKLVVGGNLVVGMVVFIIITLVQFIVIAKGSERVAEVGARFTLDAMPGKQMSIDADLRANLLTADEARHKRATLALESALHGGMDGAMKFVKGDAVAGLIITMINIVAGLAVGVLYHGMTAGEAANRFSILSVGDAMVAQLPALLLSVAAGVMITRVADDRDEKPRSLGAEIGKQLMGSAPALGFAALLLVAFAAVPGFPWPLFLVLSGILGFTAWKLKKRGPSRAFEDLEAVRSMQRAGAKSETPAISSVPPAFSCALGVRLSSDLRGRLAVDRLNQAFESERASLQEELGLPFPGIHMWISDKLPPSTCEFLMHDVPAFALELPQGKVLLADLPRRLAAAQPEDTEAKTLAERCEQRDSIDGSGQLSYWHDEATLANKNSGWRAEQVIAHVSVQLLRRNASLFLGVNEVQWIQEQLGIEYPGLLAEVQKVLPPQRIADVLRRLLEEQIPIRNIRNIMESLIAWGPKEKDVLMLTEYVRGDLARFLAHRAALGARILPAILLDGPVEQHIRQAIKQTPTGNYLALPPDQISFLVDSIESFAGLAPRPGIALVTSMDIRRYVRRMIEGRLSWLSVYSYQELGGHLELQPIGHVTA